MSAVKKLGLVVAFSLGLGLLITWCSGAGRDDDGPPIQTTTTTTTSTTVPTTTSTPTTVVTATTAPPTTTTTAPPVRQLSVLQLVVGDCVVDALAAADDIAELGVVDCAQPHQVEVYALITDPGDDAAPWPGDQILIEASASGCLAAFEPYVGRAFEDSELDILTVLPTAETWAEGDRDTLCVTTRVDGDDLVGSVEASGL